MIQSSVELEITQLKLTFIQHKEMHLMTFNIISQSIEEMLKKEKELIERLDVFKKRHPSFSYTLDRDEISNTLIVKQLRMNESIN